ncbi:MAG TPA: hypothetical protein VE338_22025 [Ktedonobacterales bacterium]|nr:hypothetical protein [Ktedonobacterales bacterium]
MDMDDQQPLSLITPSHDLYDPSAHEERDTLSALATPDLSRNARITLPLDTSQNAAFLEPPSASTYLAESVVYRPGAWVAMTLLAGPIVCAIAGAVVIGVSGAIPLWLPLSLLLWLPVLGLAWALLKSVSVTPDTVASGRPLGQWRTVAYEEIEHVEQSGMRLVISARASPPLVITPALLHRGAQLRRTLLLRLPLTALGGDLRTQAQILSEGAMLGGAVGDISGILTVRTRAIWLVLGVVVSVALLALGAVALLTLTTPLNNLPTWALALALAALAGISGYFGLWSAQDIFVNEKGLVIHYALLRRDRDVFWAQVRLVEYTPGEMALIFRGPRRATMSAGPGLLNETQARLMRQFIGHYCVADVIPALSRDRR